MDILVHPNPALKSACSPVDPTADKDLARLVRVMGERMHGAPGVGLAAPQIGVLKRVIVWDIDEDRDSLHALCNPRLVETSDETQVSEEGCLSVPGISIPIERSARVVVEGELITGETVRIEAEELLARIFQHECDHLDGIIILDRAEPEVRIAAIRRYARGETDDD
jgi:peptide deformylase